MTIATVADFVADLHRYGLLEPDQRDQLARTSPNGDAKALAGSLLHRGWLTAYQANLLLQGRGAELVLGSYVLLERLGEGGMGAVFKARHRTLDRVVALKLIRKERLANAEAVKRFRREIRAAAQLNHPNIVLAFDADEANGAHFFTMEYIEGIDLDRLVRKQGPLPPATACAYIRQAALGLRHAHERGLVHRDIKPANLLLATQSGVIKVLDMGLARLDPAEGGDSTSMLTQEGAVMGTPDYIAPEQALRSHGVDIRADLYSLGCTLYFLLSGQPPFPGGNMTEKLLRHQLYEAAPLADVPPGVSAVVRKLMAKAPKARYQTPAELAAALANPASGESHPPEAAVLPSPRNADTRIDERKVRRQAERRRLLWLNVGGGAVLLGLIGLVAFLLRPPRPQPGPTAPVLVALPLPTAPDTVDDDWVRNVQKLSADAQIEAVRAKMRQRNPGFDGQMTWMIQNGVVYDLGLVTDAVTDLSPVRALTGLTQLRCSGSVGNKGHLTDLRPLRGLKLTRLNCGSNLLTDLQPLRDLPLTVLNVGHTAVRDLSPLRQLKLIDFHCGGTAVDSIEPLRGMPIASLQIHSSQVYDLSPLANMPLTHLNCGDTPTASIAPLAGMPLANLNIAGSKVTDLGPAQSLKKLTSLELRATSVSNLQPLQDLPLVTLSISGTAVTDLTPLQQMPLVNLSMDNTGVADLKPLIGLKQLSFLSMSATKVTDLTPLRGLQLNFLIFHEIRPERDAGILKGIPTLKTINTKPVADFWKELESKPPLP